MIGDEGEMVQEFENVGADFVISVGHANGAAIYQEVMVSRGMRAGDIKPVPLDASADWMKRFTRHRGDPDAP